MDNIRGSDLVMKSCLNGRERGVDEWKELFKNSDKRFKFQGVEFLVLDFRLLRRFGRKTLRQ